MPPNDYTTELQTGEREMTNMKHYTITVPVSKLLEPDYTDGIMAESIEDAVLKFDECLDLSEFTVDEIKSFITEI
jgi:hypothetical protein